MKFYIFLVLTVNITTQDQYFVHYIKRENKDVDPITEVYILKDVVLGSELSLSSAYFDFGFNLLNHLQFESSTLLYQCTVETLDQLKSLKDCHHNTSESIGPFNIKLILTDLNFTKNTNKHFIFLFKIKFIASEKYKTVKKSIRSLDRLILLTPNEQSTHTKPNKLNKINSPPKTLITNSIKNNPIEIITIPKLKSTNNVLNSKFRLKKDIKSKLKLLLDSFLNSLTKPSEVTSPTKSNIAKLLKFQSKFRNSIDFLSAPKDININNSTKNNNNNNNNDNSIQKTIAFKNNSNSSLGDLVTDFDFKICIVYNIFKLKEDMQTIYSIYSNLFKLGQPKYYEYNEYLKGLNGLIKERTANLDDKKVDELVMKINYEKLNRLIDSNIIVDHDSSRRPSVNKLDSFYKLEPKSASKRKVETETESLNVTVIEKEGHGKSVFGKIHDNLMFNTNLYNEDNIDSVNYYGKNDKNYKNDILDKEEEDKDFDGMEEFVDATVHDSEKEHKDIVKEDIRKSGKLAANHLNTVKSKRNSIVNDKLTIRKNSKEVNYRGSSKSKYNNNSKQEDDKKNSIFVVGLFVMISVMIVVVAGCLGYKPLMTYIEQRQKNNCGVDKVNNQETDNRKKKLAKDMNVPKKPFALNVPSI